MKIRTDNLKGDPFPVYLHYASQINPQPAYIEIDLDAETIEAGTSGEIGNGVPAPVWHGVMRRIRIEADVDGDALAAFLESEDVIALIQRILDGGKVEWDGSNYVGHLDEDATAAEDKLEELAREIERNSVWDACEYFDGVKHEYIERYEGILRRGEQIDYDYEADEIESENKTDEGCGRPMLLQNVKRFVEVCAQAAVENVEEGQP